ncbi:MAG: hypothetical protein CVV49_11755 [Spirochaetae bacterium HGW-Spirochaetae-5]|nr:MAG: hypothetical protein CVV49_11755 [Spirochaetae bacterium HGW-Spirochaetae-5]
MIRKAIDKNTMETIITKRIKLHFIVPIIIYTIGIFISFSTRAISSSFLWQDGHLELSPGYTMPIGDWANELKPGFGIGLGYSFPTSFLNNQVFVIQELSYSRWAFASNDNSTANIYSYSLLPAIYFPYSFTTGKIVAPFFAVGGQFSDLNLIEEKLSKNDHYFGLFLKGRTGIFLDITSNLRVKLQAEISSYPYISHKLNYTSISLGIGYRFTAPAEIQNPNAKKIITLHNDGAIARNSEDWIKLQELVTEILALDPRDDQALYYQLEIQDEGIYQTALQTIQTKGELQAIPLLEKIAQRHKPAQQQLIFIRNKFKTKIPEWRKSGVQAYENLNYQLCVQLMKQILLVDPEEETAKIYLPRAEKRLQALEKLQ